MSIYSEQVSPESTASGAAVNRDSTLTLSSAKISYFLIWTSKLLASGQPNGDGTTKTEVQKQLNNQNNLYFYTNTASSCFAGFFSGFHTRACPFLIMTIGSDLLL